MKELTAVWGIHMDQQVGNGPVEGGYVTIGWVELGDLRNFPDREAFKAALAVHNPAVKDPSQRLQGGVLFRFIHEMRAGTFHVVI
ncbi:MAG: hypothetical protein WBO29_04410 [Albidovulum sp.]